MRPPCRDLAEHQHGKPPGRSSRAAKPAGAFAAAFVSDSTPLTGGVGGLLAANGDPANFIKHSGSRPHRPNT
jgi:hypothetical protein